MMSCPRCKGTGSVYAAGNRIARPCTSCDGKGVITEFDASFGEADREIARLEDQVREQQKRIAELEAKVELRESCLRAYSVRIHEMFGVSIVSPESWDNIPHCLAIVKLRFEKLEAERDEAAGHAEAFRVELEKLRGAA